MNPTTYTLTEMLLQAIVRELEAQPAGRTRHILNAIEAEAARQDQERAQAAQQAERERVAAELRAKAHAEPAQ